MSEEEKEILKNLIEYLQNKKNDGYHKIIYNDLDWDFKTIDGINVLNKVLEQQKEIEKLKSRKYIYNVETQEIKEIPIDDNYISKDKIKARIEYLQDNFDLSEMIWNTQDILDELEELLGE